MSESKNRKQTTLKITTKDFKVFEALAPTEGVNILGGTTVGDTMIVSVKYRDPAYMFYLGYNVARSLNAAPVQTHSGLNPNPDKNGPIVAAQKVKAPDNKTKK